jgi:hypothetical protein
LYIYSLNVEATAWLDGYGAMRVVAAAMMVAM